MAARSIKRIAANFASAFFCGARDDDDYYQAQEKSINALVELRAALVPFETLPDKPTNHDILDQIAKEPRIMARISDECFVGDEQFVRLSFYSNSELEDRYPNKKTFKTLHARAKEN
jgi:hypothetical protein